MGKRLAWIWYDLDGAATTPGGISRGGPAQAGLPGGLDAAYALDASGFSGPRGGMGAAKAGIGASASAAAATDTLIFERKGFTVLKRPVSGSESAMDLKLERTPIRILIIDGMSNHDWKQTTKVVKAIYARSGFFSVDVSTAPATTGATAWSAWTPRFKDYEAVVMNYNSGDMGGSLRWPAAKETELQDFVKDGGGLYALHAANNSFPDWADYNKMIAVGWRGKSFGHAIQVDSLGTPKRIAPGTGDGTSHGNRVDVPVRLVNAHPIHKGFPRVLMTSDLEIYRYARGPAENFEVISYAFDGPASGGSNAYWPIELMITYGKGKVYNSTMGHLWPGEIQPDAVKDVAFQTMLIRTTEWLARREVFQPVPAAFNTASKIEYQTLVLP
jgi:type 1 glutamine amidotransferase